MNDRERFRLRFTFLGLGCVPVFLAGWLGYVQVAEAGELRRESGAILPLSASTADGQARKFERLPAPRGTIVDRHGSLLAIDRETYEVRANIELPPKLRKDAAGCREWLKQLLADFSLDRKSTR